MKTINILYLSLVIILLNSCTKIIDIDLKDADKKIIIEANLIEGTHDFVAKVSKTSNYFESGAPTTVNTAVVTLNDGTTTLTLANLGNGIYSTPAYLATENTTYILTVVDGSDVYTATSIMPQKVELDSLIFEYVPASTFNEEGYGVFFYFTDPANVSNYYRGTINVNGVDTKKVDDLYLFDDELVNGNVIRIPIFRETYQANDSIIANLHSLNKANYDFYNTLSDIAGDGSGGGSTAAPANPNNNWSNGALGNFTTECISTFSAKVQ